MAPAHGVMARSREAGVRACREHVPAGNSPGPPAWTPSSPVVESNVLSQSPDEGDDNGDLRDGCHPVRQTERSPTEAPRAVSRVCRAERGGRGDSIGPVRRGLRLRLGEASVILCARRQNVDGTGDPAPACWSRLRGILRLEQLSRCVCVFHRCGPFCALGAQARVARQLQGHCPTFKTPQAAARLSLIVLQVPRDCTPLCCRCRAWMLLRRAVRPRSSCEHNHCR